MHMNHLSKVLSKRKPTVSRGFYHVIILLQNFR